MEKERRLAFYRAMGRGIGPQPGSRWWKKPFPRGVERAKVGDDDSEYDE
jgi:hypothetical protein